MSPLGIFISIIVIIIVAGLFLDYLENITGKKKPNDLIKYKKWNRR